MPSLRRFHLRTLLIAVAVVALVLWAGSLAGRSVYHRVLARWLAAKEEAYRADTLALERRTGRALTPHEVRLAEYGRRMVAYLGRQRARSEFLASHPWLPAGPAPASPEWHEP